MTWEHGYIELTCGHRVGTAHWDDLWVGEKAYCPGCKGSATITRMSRVYEAKPSRNFQLGLVGGGEDGGVPEDASGSDQGGS